MKHQQGEEEQEEGGRVQQIPDAPGPASVLVLARKAVL